jgi:hypothetical protein
MKAKEALIAYNPGTDQIAVGPLIREGDTDWTNPYRYTGGAAYIKVRDLQGDLAKLRLLSEFVGIVGRDKVDLTAALRAFMEIEEFREAIPLDMVPQEWRKDD